MYYTYKSHSKAKIKIEAWADSSGEENENATISQERANTIRKYFLKEGVRSEDIILVKGYGVDFKAETDSLARRADARLILSVIKEVVAEEPKEVVEVAKEEPIEVAAVIEPTKTEDARAAEPIEEIDTQIQVESQTTPEPQTESTPTKELPATPTPTAKTPSITYYAGVGLGTSFGRSTFASFAADGTKVGVNTNIFAGAEFSKLLSAELSIGYTAMSLGMYDCCEGLYYVDGERYFAPVAGATSYAYHDLTAKTNLWTISAKANFNIIALINENSKWQALVSPNIGIGFSSAKLKYDSSTLSKESNTHLIVGGALGVGYSINERWGVRLTSGVDYLTGGAFDAMPQCEHTNGYIWNTTASVIYKF
ncbi:MAG: OmpA family protein [Bacillota bacterium]